MSDLRFMGIDLSLTSTGVCVGGDSVAIVSKQRGTARLIEISEKILELASSSRPTAILIEGYSFGSKFSRAHAIGELGGVVKSLLVKHGYPIIDIPPTCRAKFATGKGNAGKKEVLFAVFAISGINFTGPSADDVCDAWVLEQMVLARLGESPYKWSDEQISALTKIDWEPLFSALEKGN
jgi:Holliday junction resolvasome RuvABC endonuclease subunit